MPYYKDYNVSNELRSAGHYGLPYARYSKGYATKSEEYNSYKERLKQNGNLLSIIPAEHLTTEMCNIAMANGGTIEIVPHGLRTKDMCLLSVKTNGLTVKDVPAEFLSPEMCLQAIKSNAHAVKLIPRAHLTEEVLVLAVRNNSSTFLELNDDQLTEAICTEYVKHDGMLLARVPEKFRTAAVVEAAVDSTGFYAVLQHIPKDRLTPALSEKIEAMYQDKTRYSVVGPFVIYFKDCDQFTTPCYKKHIVLFENGSHVYSYTDDICRLLISNQLRHRHFKNHEEYGKVKSFMF